MRSALLLLCAAGVGLLALIRWLPDIDLEGEADTGPQVGSPDSESPSSSAEGDAIVHEEQRETVSAPGPDPAADPLGYLASLVGPERAAEWEARMQSELQVEDVTPALPTRPCPPWEEIAPDFRMQFMREDEALPGLIEQEMILRRGSLMDTRYALHDPDYATNRRLNPDGVPLSEYDAQQLAQLDEAQREQMLRFLVEEYWPEVKAAAGRAFDEDRFASAELHIGLPARRDPPFPGAKKRYNRLLGSSGWWSARMTIWEGEDPRLDAACEELERQWQQRLYTITNYIDSSARPAAIQSGWSPEESGG